MRNKLVRARGQRDLLRLAGGEQAVVEGLDDGVVAHGAQTGHVQSAAHDASTHITNTMCSRLLSLTYALANGTASACLTASSTGGAALMRAHRTGERKLCSAISAHCQTQRYGSTEYLRRKHRGIGQLRALVAEALMQIRSTPQS